jgi:hypothetical protein
MMHRRLDQPLHAVGRQVGRGSRCLAEGIGKAIEPSEGIPIDRPVSVRKCHDIPSLFQILDNTTDGGTAKRRSSGLAAIDERGRLFMRVSIVKGLARFFSTLRNF